MAFSCVCCNQPAEVKRISYSHNDKIFSGVAIRVCVNPDCPTMQSATIYDRKTLTKPATEGKILKEREHSLEG